MTVFKVMKDNLYHRYRTIVVVDDQLNRVWNKEKPPLSRHNDTSILWVAPWRFDMNKDREDQNAVMVDASIIDRIDVKRNTDDFFWRFMNRLKTTYIGRGESMSVIIPELAWPPAQPNYGPLNSLPRTKYRN